MESYIYIYIHVYIYIYTLQLCIYIYTHAHQLLNVEVKARVFDQRASTDIADIASECLALVVV